MRRRPDRMGPGGVARAATFVLVGLVSLAAPSLARAQWKQFIPTPYDNRAWLELYSSWERDNSKGSARNVRWEDTFFREKLSFSSLGYSYDPRFLQYKLSLAGVAKQENYDNTAFRSGDWREAEAIEYDTRLYFLPEHHYNAQVFASRREPVYPQQSVNQHGSYLDDYGAIVRYRLKPWFLDANFLDSTLHQSGTRSNVKRLNVEAEYFRRFQQGYELSATGSARPSWYDDSRGLDGTADEYLFSTLFNFDRIRLDSTVTDSDFEQDRGGFDRYHTEQFAWWELLTVYFPWNFRTDLTWRMHDNESVFDDAAVPDGRRYSDDGTNVQLDVNHRLYESVDTRYRFVHDSRDSQDASSGLDSHSLSVDYTKQIPWGQLLAGGAYGNSELDNRGFASVVNDPYTATAVPGTVTLRQQNVEETTLIVQLRSPVPPFDFVTLVEGVHYLVNTAVEPFEIQLVNLPEEFVVPGSYDFFFTYSLRYGDYDLGIDTAGANLTLELFEHMVAPFFRYLGQRSDVLSGVYPGVPIDSDSYNAGVRLEYGRFRGRGEFLYLDWPVNPYRLWRAEIQYVGPVSRSITAYANASYAYRDYLGGEPPYETSDTTEQTETVSGTLTKQFFAPDLSFSVGGSWTHLHGITDSDGWSASSTLVWRIGKLDLTLGFSAYGSNSETRDSPSYQRDHELIYFNLRRQLL
jgi:hypothetical protein